MRRHFSKDIRAGGKTLAGPCGHNVRSFYELSLHPWTRRNS